MNCIRLGCLRLAGKELGGHGSQHIVTTLKQPAIAPRTATRTLKA
jgi:hypothetical protein